MSFIVGFIMPICLLIISISIICLMALPIMIGFAMQGPDLSVYFAVANILWIMLISGLVNVFLDKR